MIGVGHKVARIAGHAKRKVFGENGGFFDIDQFAGVADIEAGRNFFGGDAPSSNFVADVEIVNSLKPCRCLGYDPDRKRMSDFLMAHERYGFTILEGFGNRDEGVMSLPAEIDRSVDIDYAIREFESFRLIGANVFMQHTHVVVMQSVVIIEARREDPWLRNTEFPGDI